MKHRRKSVLSPGSHASSSKKKARTEARRHMAVERALENGSKFLKKVTFGMEEEKPKIKQEIKQEPPEKVCPPPEYVALNYNEICPKVNELLCLDQPTQMIPQVEMIRLQHDLEFLLAFATSAHNRAVGEVAFLTSGDYPTVDLSGRPSATYTNRFIPEVDDNTYTLDNLEMAKQTPLSVIPVDEFPNDNGVWPPSHLPTRFWKWCMEYFLKPLDADFLREYKKILVDEVVPTVIEKLYINEPWKHRKRDKPRGGRGSNPPKRKNLSRSPEFQPPKKRPPTRDRIYESIATIVSIVCKELKMQPQPQLPPMPVLEKRVNRKYRPPVPLFTDMNKKSVALASLLEGADLQEEYRLNPPAPEPEEEEPLAIPDEAPDSPYKNLRSPRMTSPRIKMEVVEADEEEQEPFLNGHAATNGNGIYLNGKTTPKRRRNSDRREEETPKTEKTVVRELDIKHEPEENGLMMNGTHETRSKKGAKRASFSNGSVEKKKNGVKEKETEEIHEEPKEEDKEEELRNCALALCSLKEVKREIEEIGLRNSFNSCALAQAEETIEDLRNTNVKVEVMGVDGYGKTDVFVSKEEALFHFQGERIIKCLVVNNLLPEMVLSMFTFFLGHDLNIDYCEEGREDDDDEIDEVSIELMKAQRELKEIEPEVRGAVLHCWFKLQEDFAFWETLRQLDEADSALFRLVDNTYNEFPRRFPKPNEWASLMTAYSRHIDKAKLHYGQKFIRHPIFRIHTARRVEDPHDVEELL